MALSNWDTLAFNNEAEPCDGVLKIEHEGNHYSSVEIYKNWLYVRDTRMWIPDQMFVEPVIMEIQEGGIMFGMFEINASRGPQNSVLTYIEYEPYRKEKVCRMAGIGCYGFDDNGNWTGVQQETLDALLDFMQNLISEYDKEEMAYLEKIRNAKPMRFCQGDGYILKEIGINDNTATPIGEAEDPLIIQMIRGPKEK